MNTTPPRQITTRHPTNASPRRWLALFLAMTSAASCATNPARQLIDTDEDISVDDNGTFKRGDDVLDEQELYTLVHDAPSMQAVADVRAGG